MAEIEIERCELRLRRRGASMRHQQRRLVDAAARTVPDVCAAVLERLVPEAADFFIAETLQIRLRVAEAELLAPEASPDLRGRVARALADALGREPAFVDALDAAPMPEPEPEPARVSAAARWCASLLRILAGWRERGELRAMLAGFSVPTLLSWQRALFAPGVAASAAAADATSPADLDALVRRVSAEWRDRGPETRLRARLAAAVEIFVQLGAAPYHVGVHESIDRELPLDHTTLTSGATSVPSAIVESAAAPRASGDVHVTSALPFLLLGPLARLGVLDTLGAVFDACSLTDRLPYAAAALAYKVLDRPERGWRRSPAAVAAAAAFAGFAGDPPDEALHDLARVADPAAHALDEALHRALVAGCATNTSLLVYRTGAPHAGFLLLDVADGIPLGWAEDERVLISRAGAVPGALLLVPAACADPTLLGSLDSAGLRFITDAPPVRHERWRRIRRGESPRWTNDDRTAPHDLARAARPLDADAPIVDPAALWDALAHDRPAFPLARGSALERTFTLIAAAALGALAAALWHERGPTDPLLALDRLADLDARVRTTPARLRVTVPLGRRHADLFEHGLLSDVAGVPWLGGRPVEFSGG